MKEEQFIEKNGTIWGKLEQYNSKLSFANINSLNKDNIKEFASLYRVVAHQLAYAKTHFPKSKTTIYLNQLVAVSHNFFYTRENSSLNDVIHYFKAGFPTALMKNKRYFFMALGLFATGALCCFLFSLINIEYAYFFIPESVAKSIDLSSRTRYVDFPSISAFIMANNIRVSFMAFVWGITAGIGTGYVLLLNGGVVGSITAIVATSQGNMSNYWALILPHGFIELTAIFISGAAGLIIGESILIPQKMSRAHSLVKGGKEACYFLPGITVMLIIAGIIEGFFTPLNIPNFLKFLLAFATLVFLIVYFVLCGRNRHVE